MVTHRVAPFCVPVLGATTKALSFKQFANGTVVIGGKLIGSLDFLSRHGEVEMVHLGGCARAPAPVNGWPNAFLGETLRSSHAGN